MINYIKGESLSKIWTNIKNYVTAKISTKAEDDEVVKLTGAQSVSGQKTFKSNVIVENSNPLFLIKNSTVNKGTNPSTNVYCGMWLNDKNGTDSKNRVAGLGCEINTAGRYRSYLCVYKPLENDTTYSQISISYSSDGTITTSTPTPPENSNDSQIANTSWCRNNLVTKDSTQTITGAKTFSNGLAFDDTRDAITLWKKIKADKGEVLTTDQSFEILLSDKTGNTNWVNRLAYIRLWYAKDTGNTNASIGVFSSKDNALSTNSQISIQYDKANNKYITSAPTPPINDNSTQIATTAWVTAKDNNVVHKTGNETVEGVKTFTPAGSGGAVLLFKPGTLKKGDITDGHVSRIYHGDAANYANALHIYETGTTDNGDRTYTNFVTITNTAGISNTTNRTTLTINFHKNPTDGRKQYATLSGDFLPSAANTYNLGSEINPWATLQATTGVFKDDVWVGGDQLMITSDETEVFTGRRISWAKNAGTLPTKAYNLNFSLGGNNSAGWSNRIGGFRVALNTTGDVETAMYAHDTTGASKGQGMIGIYYKRATDSYETIAPTPPANDNSTQIATTEWVRALLAEKGL